MNYYILDIEANALEDPDRVWCANILDHQTGSRHEFLEPDTNDELISFVSSLDKPCFVGHHILGYDWPVLCDRVRGMADVQLDPATSFCDTLVISRLLNYGIDGGHSLDAWGKRLGCLKAEFDQWDRLSPEMVAYCWQDVTVTHKLFQHFWKYVSSERWKLPIRIEHDTATFTRTLHRNGFHLSLDDAKDFRERIDGEIQTLDISISSAFPPKATLVREVTPRSTKFGTLNRSDFRWLGSDDLSAYQPGASFSVIEFEPFNPASPVQIVERLNEAGWKPFEKTKGHIEAERGYNRKKTPANLERLERFRLTGWKVSEDNLGTLPESAPDGARSLARRLVLGNRRSTLTEWVEAAQVKEDSRVHGGYYHIGAWTHRMSHAAPNTANIPTRADAIYSHEMRALWSSAVGRVLVGVDADAIQLRVLAHWMRDERFTEALVSGDKNLGTDAHTLNKLALGDICKSRDDAKTFIYAWLLGAGIGKLAQILGCTHKQARDAVNKFLDFYPGLVYIRKTLIPADAKRGYFEGIDGRLIICDSEHHMLSGYLQSGEAIVMKLAASIWWPKVQKQFPGMVWPVNFVHDEFQTEVQNVDGIPLEVAKIQADAIAEAGDVLKLRCPMLGSYINSKGKLTIGVNWAETH